MAKSLRLIVNSAVAVTPSGARVFVAGNEIDFVTPWSSRLPVTVCVAPLAPPATIEVEVNFARAKCSASKKSFDLRCVSSLSWSVLSYATSMSTATLLVSILPPTKKSKPEPFGALAGRTALRIDTTSGADARTRFIKETLERLDATAEPRVLSELAASDADLGSVRNDLEKLALGGKNIAYADLERESLTVEDPKAWQYASLLVEGRAAEALAVAFELFANDPRGAAVPLVSALATEFGLLWELSRPGGGDLPPRHAWRERKLRPAAQRIGERRARYAYESAVRGFEAVVTGRIDDPRAMIEILTADLAAKVVRRG